MKKIFAFCLTIFITIILSSCAQETTDDKFLNALEMLNSIEYSEEDYANNLDQIIKYELSVLEEFKNAEFVDANIKQAFKNYISGLEKMKEYVNHEISYIAQVGILEGKLKCMRQIEYLYNKYSFMNDNSYIYNNILQIDYLDDYLDSMVEIIKDLNNTGIIKNYWEGYTWYIIFENNTEFSYSITFEIEHINKDGIVVEKEYASAEKVKPNEKYAISIPYSVGMSGNYPEFYARNYSIDWIGV